MGHNLLINGGWIGVITQLLTIDPKFQRDIQVKPGYFQLPPKKKMYEFLCIPSCWWFFPPLLSHLRSMKVTIGFSFFHAFPRKIGSKTLDIPSKKSLRRAGSFAKADDDDDVVDRDDPNPKRFSFCFEINGCFFKNMGKPPQIIPF